MGEDATHTYPSTGKKRPVQHSGLGGVDQMNDGMSGEKRMRKTDI